MELVQSATPPPYVGVANEVRAWLARRRITAARAASRLGWTQPYLSRRLTGSVPFDVADLISLADLLDVAPEEFFRSPSGGRARNIIYYPPRLIAA